MRFCWRYPGARCWICHANTPFHACTMTMLVAAVVVWWWRSKKNYNNNWSNFQFSVASTKTKVITLPNHKRQTKKMYKQYPPFWRENMLGYLSADIICSEKRTVFRGHSSSKTASFEEQIMSKDKYSNIFLPQMEAIKSFSQLAQFWKLGNICMLFAGWEVRIVKNCDRGLKNAARGRRPRAAF